MKMTAIDLAKEAVKAPIKYYLRYKVERDWKTREANIQSAHSLDGELIVSLTSFPRRFRQLPLTIKCLLNQSVKPDRVILWLGEGDVPEITDELRRLEKDGLEIRICVDHRQYNKIIPSLKAFPDAFVVTADDDLYYWRDWLKSLIATYSPAQKEIICHRAHRIRLDRDGLPMAYSKWSHNTGDSAPSEFIFPTGVGGVLYRPGIFPPEVIDSETYLKLSPTTDDVWLYFMAGLNGATYRKTGKRRFIFTWPGSQKVSLRSANIPVGGGNDRHMSAMIRRFGFPPTRVLPCSADNASDVNVSIGAAYKQA